jgi:hypothetical protein
MGSNLLTFFIFQGDFAAGLYNGKWNIHVAERDGYSYTHANIHGIWDMEITEWLGTGKTGNLVVLGASRKLTIIGGTMDGQTFNDQETSTDSIAMLLYEYRFTRHFEP